MSMASTMKPCLLIAGFVALCAAGPPAGAQVLGQCGELKDSAVFKYNDINNPADAPNIRRTEVAHFLAAGRALGSRYD